MSKSERKKAPTEPSMDRKTNSIDEILSRRISRRQALSTGAKAGIGVAAVVIVGAASYLAYTSLVGGSTTTTSSTTTSTTPTSASTSTTTASTSSSSITSSTTSASSTSSSTSASGSGATIDVFTISGPIYEIVTHSGKDYSTAHPTATITVEQVDETTFESTYNTRFSTAPPPDMAFQYPGPAYTYTLADAGLLLNLDDAIAKYGWDKFNPGYKNYIHNGHAYVMTQDYVSYPHIYYNPDIFNKLGVSEPKTLQDFYALCDKVRAGGYLSCTFGVQTAPAWTCNVFTFLLANIMAPDKYKAFLDAYGTNFGKPAFKDRTVTWNDPDVVKALQMEQDFGNKVWTSGYTGMSDDDAIGLFAQAKSAMYQSGSWGPAVLDPAVKNFTYKVFAVPADWSVLSPPAIASVDNSFAISNRTKSPDLCTDFLDFLLNKDEQTWMANNQGTFPARNDMPASIFTNAHMADNFQIFLQHQPHMVVQLLISGKLFPPLTNAVLSVLNGQATPTQAAATMETTAITQSQS